MRAFEAYQEVKKEHANPAEQELLQLTYLQGAWAEMKVASIESEEEREKALVNWMEGAGDWFRKNILEHDGKIGEESRKVYFLRLFDSDPEKAVQELDQLFQESQH